MTVARPFFWVGVFWLFAASGYWLLAVITMAFVFVGIVNAAHDLVHASLSLPPRLNELLLSLVGMLVLESGHAYRLSHMQHHRTFPNPDNDPEGNPARMSFWRAVAEGPVFLFRLWWWGFRRHPKVRVWLAIEAGWFIGFAVTSVVWLEEAPALMLYFVLCVMGSWTYPLLTVHLPHDVTAASPYHQTHTLRGVIVPKLFLELTFHLEHHLYPAVPSHHYRELAHRLQPTLDQAGVVPKRVW